MKRALFILLFAVAAPLAARPAAAQRLVPSPPPPLALVPTAPRPEPPPRYPRLRPIPFFWRELDAQRANQGLAGRKNATRDEQRVAETPSLRPRPLSSW